MTAKQITAIKELVNDIGKQISDIRENVQVAENAYGGIIDAEEWDELNGMLFDLYSVIY